MLQRYNYSGYKRKKNKCFCAKGHFLRNNSDKLFLIAAILGLSSSSDGTITCRLTGSDGKPQGAITYQATMGYYCAEVVFSPEVKSATGISRLRFIPYDSWPEEGNGFVSDLLDKIKK